MTIFTQTNPLLPVNNITMSMAFYDRLGFQRVWEDIDYGILRRDGIEIHLWKCPDPRVAENTSCRIQVSGLDELYEVYSMFNVVHPNNPIETEPWGGRSFGILDLDGNLIKFFEAGNEKNPSRRMEKVENHKK